MSKRKYRKGSVILSPIALNAFLQGTPGFVILRDKPVHAGFLSSMQYRTVVGFLDCGLLFEAIETDSHETDDLYCHVCGNRDLVYEGPAEGYSCPKCGSSDSDE